MKNADWKMTAQTPGLEKQQDRTRKRVVFRAIWSVNIQEAIKIECTYKESSAIISFNVSI